MREAQRDDRFEPIQLQSSNLNSSPALIAESTKVGLVTGTNTRYGGLFFFLPLLNRLGLGDFFGIGSAQKRKGPSHYSLFLVLLAATLVGMKRLNKMDAEQDHGLALFAGLPFSPSVSLLHEFCSTLTHDALDRMKVETAKRFHALGVIKGDIVNIDAHMTEYYGDLPVPKGHHGTKDKAVKCYQALCAQDQQTRVPIYHWVTTPDVSPIQQLPRFIAKLREILGHDACFKIVFDRGFFKGALFQEICEQNLRFVTLARRCKTVVNHMDALPEALYTDLCKGVQKLDTFVHLTNCEMPLRMLVIRSQDDKHEEPKLIGVLTNDTVASDEDLVKTYALRWHIENMFKYQKEYFGLDALPGMDITKIDLLLWIKSLAHTLFIWLQAGMTGRLRKASPETLSKRVICRSARLQLVNGYLVACFSFFKERRYLPPWMKLGHAATAVPWLHNSSPVFSVKKEKSVS